MGEVAAINKDIIRTIFFYAKKHIVKFILAEICIIVLYLVSLLLPWNLRRLIDIVIYESQYSKLVEILVIYLILFVVSFFTNICYAYIWQKLNNSYIVNIKTDMYKKVLNTKAKYLSELNTGDVVSRIEWDSDQFIHVIQRNVFHLINSIVMCIAILCIIFSYNIMIGLLSVVSVVLPYLLSKLLDKKTKSIMEKNRDNVGILEGKVYDLFSGFREIKLHNAQYWAEKQIIEPINNIADTTNQKNIISLSVQKISKAINVMCTIILYVISTYLIINSKITIGVFLAIVQYFSLLNYKFEWIITICNDWHWRKVCINRCIDVLNFENEDEDDKGDAIKTIDSVEFKNVSFAYNYTPVLKNISFRINKGEIIGLVGVSGVGKTTLLSLLLRLYEPDEGEILINGKSIIQYNVHQLRQSIGIVSQDVQLFDDTIKFNLLFNKNIDEKLLERCLDKAFILQKIKELPLKLETVIGENGNCLSGGQTQRIMIARMLLNNACMYVCDEATSALDTETEDYVSEEIYNIMNDKIGIIISHRYRALCFCTKILVLKEGRIDALGTDKELKRCCDEYIKIFGGSTNAK